MQKVRLPILETEDSAWEFFEILFEELRCEPFYEKDPETSATKGIKNDAKQHYLPASTTTTTLTFSASAAGFSPPLRVRKEESVNTSVFLFIKDKFTK